MSVEHERQIEKLMKAAAERRRHQAGDPQMHPAMRETLRTEVRRQFGASPGRSTTPMSWLKGWLPKLAIIAVVVAAGWLFFAPGKKQEPTVLAKKEEPSVAQKEVREAAPKQEAASLSSVRAPEPVPRQAPASVSLTTTALPQSARATSAVSESKPRATSEISLAADKDLGIRLDSAETKATRLLDENALKLPSGQSSSEVSMLSFTPGRKAASSEFSLTREPFPVTNVLQHFTVVQSGEEIRVTDADGSTYRGTVRPVRFSRIVAGASSQQPTPTAAAPATRPALLKARMATSDSVEPLISFDFDASGTNVSLGQKVRFEGKLVLPPGQAAARPNAFSNTLSPAQSLSQQQTKAGLPAEANGRVTGTAVIDGIETIRVEAVPAKPH